VGIVVVVAAGFVVEAATDTARGKACEGAGDCRHELIEVSPAQWMEVAERCQAVRADEEAAPDGHLVKLRLDDHIYEIYVGKDTAIVCGKRSIGDDSGAVPAADPQLSRWLDHARQKLAQRLLCSVDDIELLRIERVVWRDSSLGCPQPGLMYGQVLTEGVRIILRAEGRDHHFHGGSSAPPFLCEHPSPVEPLPSSEVE
jgi:hypothetical protein